MSNTASSTPDEIRFTPLASGMGPGLINLIGRVRSIRAFPGPDDGHVYAYSAGVRRIIPTTGALANQHVYLSGGVAPGLSAAQVRRLVVGIQQAIRQVLDNRQSYPVMTTPSGVQEFRRLSELDVPVEDDTMDVFSARMAARVPSRDLLERSEALWAWFINHVQVMDGHIAVPTQLPLQGELSHAAFQATATQTESTARVRNMILQSVDLVNEFLWADELMYFSTGTYLNPLDNSERNVRQGIPVNAELMGLCYTQLALVNIYEALNMVDSLRQIVEHHLHHS